MVNDFFLHLGYLLLLINTVLFFSKYRREAVAFRIFCYYSLAMLMIQLYSFILTKLKSENLFLSHWYFIIQFLLLSFFYLKILTEKWQKKVVQLVMPICIVVLFVQYYHDPSLYPKFNLLEIFITSFPLVVYSAFHLYNMLNNEKEFYYISLGVLIYLMGSTCIFLVGNLSLTLLPKFFFEVIWNLNVYLYVIYQLFFLTEYYKKYKLKKSKA